VSFQRFRHFLKVHISELDDISPTQVHINILKHQACGDLLQLWPEKKKEILTAHDWLAWDRFSRKVCLGDGYSMKMGYENFCQQNTSFVLQIPHEMIC